MKNKVAEESVGKKLTKRQLLFCKLFVSEDFYGNGTQAYLEVYDIDHSKPNWYKTATAAAARLLANVRVCAQINKLLEDGGLNDNFVDKQLLFLLTQNADYTNKAAAIREYNKLKSRITDKVEVTLPKPIYDGKSIES